jgi:hypothetical protein
VPPGTPDANGTNGNGKEEDDVQGNGMTAKEAILDHFSASHCILLGSTEDKHVKPENNR